MKLSKRSNTIILWIISIGLLVSMVIAFTPSIGNLFGAGAADSSTPAILVNGEPITELEIARVRSQEQLFAAVTEGEAGEDLELLLVDNLINRELLSQAAARTRVSNGEVRDAVREFRESNNVADDDQRYLSLLRNAGLTDADFRELIRNDLQQQKYLEELVADVELEEGEAEAFYQANRSLYTGEPRIRARMIVLADQAQVGDVYARLLSGEDFAAVAREVSVERAEQGGAVGAAAGSSEPTLVGSAALPSAVANAAFALQGPGLTMPVVSGGRSYIVQVEEYIPAQQQAFEEVEEEVRENALEVKKQAAQQAALEELRAQATITVPEGSSYSLEDPVVARVGEAEIHSSDLVEATYLNPQIQQFLTPDTASLVTSFFKPTILEQLISQELAYQGAQELDIELVGTKPVVAQSARNYVSRDAEVTSEEIESYYAANTGEFTVPARVVATRVDFASQEAASQFQSSLLQSEAVTEEELVAAAESAGGEVEPLGVVTAGQLPTELDTALFGTDAFSQLPGSPWSVSDVLVVSEEVEPAENTEETTEESAAEGAEAGAEGEAVAEAADEPAETEQPETQETFVVLAAVRQPQQVRPLEEVRAQVETAVLASKRQELSDTWLAGLRDEIVVENLLEEVTAATDEGEAGEPEGEGAPEEGAPEGEGVGAAEETAEPAAQEPAGDTP